MTRRTKTIAVAVPAVAIAAGLAWWWTTPRRRTRTPEGFDE